MCSLFTSCPFSVRLCSSVFSSTFFFYCYAHHRALHSFPTRRSSDLSCILISVHSSSPMFTVERSGFLTRFTNAGVDPAHKDRKSTRLNSSHQIISYAVFCLKKKKKNNQILIEDALVNHVLREIVTYY